MQTQQGTYAKPWNHGPEFCANEDCQRSLRTINPTYTIKGKNIAFCSRACRATETKEEVHEVRVPPLGQPETTGNRVAEPAKPKVAKPAGPWTNLEGKIHILRKDQKFQGIRGQVWALIKEGMKVKELYDKCAKAGLEGRGNLRVIIVVYKCVEIKCSK